MNKVGSGCYSRAGTVMSEAGGRKRLEDMIFHEERADYRCKLFPTFTHPTQSTMLSALGNTRWVGGWMDESIYSTEQLGQLVSLRGSAVRE